MADERWRELLPLLRVRDPLAEAEVVDLYYQRVFRVALRWARYSNSNSGAMIPDPDLRDLAAELTGEAFATAFDRIAEYDDAQSGLPTWIVWRVRALFKGIVGRAIREALRGTVAVQLDDPESEVAAEAELGRRPSVHLEEPEALVLRSLQRAEIAAILREMPADQSRAIIEVWIQPRVEMGETEIASAARRMGRTPVAMDSLLRRAAREFRRRWQERSDRGPDRGAE